MEPEYNTSEQRRHRNPPRATGLKRLLRTTKRTRQHTKYDNRNIPPKFGGRFASRQPLPLLSAGEGRPQAYSHCSSASPLSLPCLKPILFTKRERKPLQIQAQLENSRGQNILKNRPFKPVEKDGIFACVLGQQNSSADSARPRR
jgi:hypothetical protein